MSRATRRLEPRLGQVVRHVLDTPRAKRGHRKEKRSGELPARAGDEGLGRDELLDLSSTGLNAVLDTQRFHARLLSA